MKVRNLSPMVPMYFLHIPHSSVPISICMYNQTVPVANFLLLFWSIMHKMGKIHKNMDRIQKTFATCFRRLKIALNKNCK